MSVAPPKKQRRLITASRLELLEACTADHMSRYRGKHCTHLFHTYEAGKKKLEITVHGFVGEASGSAFSELLVAGSHRHAEFFEALSKHQEQWRSQPCASPMTWYPKLKLRQLNEHVQDVKKTQPETKLGRKIRKALTEKQLEALPDQFYSVCLPLQHSCLIVVNPRVLRCLTSAENCSTVRWKIEFKCLGRDAQDTTFLLTSSDSLSVYPRPIYARNYECKHAKGIQTQSPWPTQLKMPEHWDDNLLAIFQKRLHDYGFAVLPLSSVYVQQQVEKVSHYLKQLMAWPAHLSPLSVEVLKKPLDHCLEKKHLYRNVKQRQSKHIPDRHGRTRYGHYCTSLKTLATDLSLLISHAFRATFSECDQIWVTTAEIIVQGG